MAEQGNRILHIMSWEAARRTAKRYVCSMCWGELLVLPIPGTTGQRWTCACAKGEGFCSGHNYVTRKYAEKRRQASIGERKEVMRLYPQYDPNRFKNEKQLLAEMGF